MTITTYTYEEGTNGTTVAVGNGVDQVTGTPSYATAAAVHGTLGVSSVGSSQYLRYPISSSNSGSVYVKPSASSTGANRVLQFLSGTDAIQVSVRFSATGTAITIADSTSTTVGAASTTTWAVGDQFRFDWQYDSPAANSADITLRIFKGSNFEGTTPDETMTRTVTWATGATTSKLRVGSSAASWTIRHDTLRTSDALEWIGPYATPGITGTVAFTDAADTAVGAGDVTSGSGSGITGTIALTDVGDTVAAAGTVTNPSSTTYLYEEGTDGATVAVGNGVDEVTGTPSYTTAAAVHGTLGVSSAGAAQYLRYPISAVGSGSVYASQTVNAGSSANRVLVWLSSTNAIQVSFRFHSTGKFTVADSAAATVGAASTTTWAVGDQFRFDWQYDSPTAGSATLTLRIFKGANAEGATPDETMTRTVTWATGTTTSKLRVGSSIAGWTTLHDTLRTTQVLEWIGPYAPSGPAVGSVAHTWVGTPSQSGFVVVARVVAATSVRLAISTSSSMTSPSYVGPDTPDAEGYIRFDVFGLTAGTQYWYQLTNTPSGGTETLIGYVGKTRTLPAAGPAQGFTVALGACTNANKNDGAAHASIVAWNPNFMVHTGDFYYLTTTSTDPSTYRNAYQNQITTYPSHDVLCRDMPMFYTISDHECGLDNADSNNAWNAVHDTVYKQVAPYAGGTVRYHTWVVGRVRFIMLDTRTADRSPGLSTDNSSKTMLGATQKAWLFTQLAQPEPLKVIISDVPWMGPASTTNGEDKWWAYSTERAEIATYINNNLISVDLWTGDSHSLAATTGANNQEGGFSVLQSAPLANIGGGRNLTEHDLLYNTGTGEARQYMRITFTDNGSTITRTASAWDATGGGIQRFQQIESWTTAFTGTIAYTDNDDTIAAAGVVVNIITGTASWTDNDDSVVAAGTVVSTGTGQVAWTDTNDTVAAAGTAVPAAITATIAFTDQGDLVAAVGSFALDDPAILTVQLFAATLLAVDLTPATTLAARLEPA